MNCPAIAANYPAGIFEFVQSGAVSDEANCVQNMFQQTRQHFRSSLSLGYSLEECRNQLLDAWQQATTENWDGYNADAAQREAVANAYVFIEAFPSNVPMPQVAIDPDGEVSFDWFHTPRRQFSISIGANNVLFYAGLFGSDKVSGRERFQGAVPRTFIDHIKRVAA